MFYCPHAFWQSVVCRPNSSKVSRAVKDGLLANCDQLEKDVKGRCSVVSLLYLCPLPLH